MTNMIAPSLNRTCLAAVADNLAAAGGQTTRVSIFAIIIVGLIGGLIVGLITTPNTLQGFFLGFAGGALITVAIYAFATGRSQPLK